jgi:hypothetical protein
VYKLNKKDRDKQSAQDEVSRVSKKAAKIIKRAGKKKEMETKSQAKQKDAFVAPYQVNTNGNQMLYVKEEDALKLSEASHKILTEGAKVVKEIATEETHLKQRKALVIQEIAYKLKAQFIKEGRENQIVAISMILSRALEGFVSSRWIQKTLPPEFKNTEQQLRATSGRSVRPDEIAKKLAKRNRDLDPTPLSDADIDAVPKNEIDKLKTLTKDLLKGSIHMKSYALYDAYRTAMDRYCTEGDPLCLLPWFQYKSRKTAGVKV